MAPTQGPTTRPTALDVMRAAVRAMEQVREKFRLERARGGALEAGRGGAAEGRAP